MGSVAKSYLRKGFLLCEEMFKYLTIYEEAVSHIRLCNQSLLNFLYMKKLLFSFLSVYSLYWQSFPLFDLIINGNWQAMSELSAIERSRMPIPCSLISVTCY